MLFLFLAVRARRCRSVRSCETISRDTNSLRDSIAGDLRSRLLHEPHGLLESHIGAGLAIVRDAEGVDRTRPYVLHHGTAASPADLASFLISDKALLLVLLLGYH